MKSYPYIGKVEADGGSSILIKSSKSVGYIIKNNLDDSLMGVWEGGYSGDAHIKNITAEYLANTYGEVKSKEHAEFIVKLCENAGIGVFLPIHDINHFVIKEKLSFHNCKSVTTSELKKITIPLPPECESVDEWPKVNDDVFYKGQKWTFVAKHNDMAMLFWTGDEYCTAKISELQKPKTPGQELRDEISDLAFNQFNDDSYDLTHNSYYLAEQLISKYNITKKGEGDGLQ